MTTNFQTVVANYDIKLEKLEPWLQIVKKDNKLSNCSSSPWDKIVKMTDIKLWKMTTSYQTVAKHVMTLNCENDNDSSITVYSSSSSWH